MANALPWWRFAAPPLAWVVTSLALAGATAALAALTRRLWRGRQAAWPLLAAGLVGLISAVVVIADPFSDRIFTRDAPTGSPGLVAARLYGYGNSVFAILVTGAIFAAALFAERAWYKAKRLAAALPIAAIGLVVLVLDSYPTLGADFGGAIGIVAGFAVMALLAAEAPVHWKWAGLATLTGLAAACGGAWLDYSRGPGRWTHLGGFVQAVMNGEAGEVLARKGAMWLRLSVGPAVGLTAGALLCVWLARSGAFDGLKTKTAARTPLAKPLLAGLATTWLLGSLLNDSGLVVAVAGLAVAGPLLSSSLVRLDRSRPGASVRRLPGPTNIPV
jgi:hypothetical protein